MNRRLLLAVPVGYLAGCLLIRITTGPVAMWALVVGSLGLAALVGLIVLIANWSAEQHANRERAAVERIERDRTRRALAAQHPRMFSPHAVDGRSRPKALNR